jgi:ATP-dependent 26S proteasome regulatory subunit
MDEAFTRRFQSMIHFTMPGADERLRLWEQAFAGTCELDADVNLGAFAQQHELAGGAIINVLRYCALAVIARGQRRVTKQDLVNGIRRELRKENKTVSLAG